jgi:hypothetical protein
MAVAQRPTMSAIALCGRPILLFAMALLTLADRICHLWASHILTGD